MTELTLGSLSKLAGAAGLGASEGLGRAAGGAFATPRVGEAGGFNADFGSALKDAVGALEALGATADANALKLATGQNVDIHEVMLSMEQASLGFGTALQVRNKLVDAYQEIMRMSI